jgi:hypothetical protein
MLGIVLALPFLLIAATAMAQSPKVDQPPASAGSSTQRARCLTSMRWLPLHLHRSRTTSGDRKISADARS